MHDSVETLWTLNDLFMALSDSYVKDLTEQSAKVEDSLYDESTLVNLSAALLAIMIISALYFFQTHDL